MTKQTKDPSAKVYCKIWGCNHQLANLKAIIKEEDTQHYWNHLQWYRANLVTKIESMDYLTMYRHDLIRGGKSSGLIERELMKCYELFQIGDDGITKYYTD